ncbi:hypothetical protein AX289_09995 [Methylorubrum populi]|nr:hypothetical protein AX289_09995 [Methylorubrum populi]
MTNLPTHTESRAKMRLPVDFIYSVGYVPPRAQNKRQMPMQGSMVLELEELDPAATEHVANVTVRRQFSYSSDRYVREGKSPPVRVLYADGSFWREDMALDDLRRQLATGAIERGFLANLTARGTHSSEHGDVAGLSNEQRAAKVLSHVPSDRWKDDGGAATAESFRRRAKSMAVFDGGVFVRTPMPVIELSRYSSRGLTIGSSRSYGPGEESENDGEHRFDLDEAEKALEFQKRLNPEKGEVDGRLEIEILKPGIWEAASHRDAVIDIAKDAFNRMMQKPDELPVEVLDRAFDLRDALIECAGEVTPMLLQVLEDLRAMPRPSDEQVAEWTVQASQYGERSWNKGRSANLAEGAAAIVDEIVALAGRAIARWEMRKPDASWERHLTGSPVVWDEDGSVRQILTLSEARVLERMHGLDLSHEVGECLEGRARLHVAATGGFGVSLRHASPHVLLLEDEGGLRVIAAHPRIDVDAVSSVAERLTGRAFASAAPAMAPGGGR